MSNVAFVRARKERTKLRLAIGGPSKSGKTWTSLVTAEAIVGGVGKEGIALVDSERDSAAKYADRFLFDHLVLESHHPERYIEAVNTAVAGGYEVLVLDGISPEWSGGVESLLELVDRFTAEGASNNAFTSGWSKATPLHSRWIDVILRAPLHVICTMRVKTAYVLETDERGRSVPKKVGMQPIQREGLEYEFDIFGSLDSPTSNTLTVEGSRYPSTIPNGSVWPKPGEDEGAWCNAILKAIAEGEEPEALPEASEEDVEKLKALLLAEGIGHGEVEKGLSLIRGRNRGTLPPEVIAAKISDAEERAKARADKPEPSEEEQGTLEGDGDDAAPAAG